MKISGHQELLQMCFERKLEPIDVVNVMFLERDLRRSWWLRLLMKLF